MIDRGRDLSFRGEASAAVRLIALAELVEIAWLGGHISRAKRLSGDMPSSFPPQQRAARRIPCVRLEDLNAYVQ